MWSYGWVVWVQSSTLIPAKSFGLKPEKSPKSVCKWKLTWKLFHDIFEFLEKRYHMNDGILLQKLFWPTVRKNCCSVWETFLKFEVEGQEFEKTLRSPKWFIRTVKGQNNFWYHNAFLTYSWRFFRSNKLLQL